ncbi:MAG: hypothetical protein AAB393_04920, partial [Bacteroidota bacterium]
LEGLSGIGSGNVSVSGSKSSGYTLEFIGLLAGQNIAGLSLDIAAPEASVSVSTTRESKAGVDEIKLLTIGIPGQTPAPVGMTVAESVKGAVGADEAKYIVFTDPYNGQGSYDISLSDEPTVKVTGVVFKQSMTLTNETNIQAALVSLFQQKYANVDAGDISVKFNQKSSGGQRYDITFKGDLASLNIPDITITNHLSSGRVLPYNAMQGASGSNEVQTLSISNPENATGSFTLSLAYNSKTYKTAALALNCSATDIQTVLNTSLQSLGANITHVTGSNGTYQISFAGALAGKDLSLLTLSKSVDTPTPAGSFTIGTAGKTTGTVAYSTNTTTQAENI